MSRVCQVLGVSRSGYYARRRRRASARVREDRRLKQEILQIHVESHRRYGTPRIEQALRRRGIATSRSRVARLRRELGLEARTKRRFRATTDSNHSLPVAPDLLKRRFQAERPDQIWVGDITYLSQPRGWLYLAVLMDVYSRRIVGWALRRHITEDLALDALRQALQARRPAPGLIHHSDRGVQYTSRRYRESLAEAGLVASMSRKGDCWDNAMAESLIKTVKTELGSHFSGHRKAKTMLFDYIEGFYNTRRLHSGLDYRPPAEVERLAAAHQEALAPPALAGPASAFPHPQTQTLTLVGNLSTKSG